MHPGSINKILLAFVEKHPDIKKSKINWTNPRKMKNLLKELAVN